MGNDILWFVLPVHMDPGFSLAAVDILEGHLFHAVIGGRGPVSIHRFDGNGVWVYLTDDWVAVDEASQAGDDQTMAELTRLLSFEDLAALVRASTSRPDGPVER